MKLAISGSSGLVGSALRRDCTAGGDETLRLVRGEPGAGETRWDPSRGLLEPAALEGWNAVVHLAGKGIASGRWTNRLKQEIRDSRVEGTQSLCRDLAALDHKPEVLVSASAIGYYGDRGEERLTEDSGPGTDFLAQVCREWEAATGAAREAGIRVVNLRFGVILSPRGGALQKMLLPFRLGLGGIVGDGRQLWSWVSLADVVGAIRHAIVTPGLSGPVNVTAPRPATNREFTKSLGRALRRPTLFPMPAFAARLVFGEMADALLLASQNVAPSRLQDSGYEFRHADLEGCLRDLLR